MNLISGIVDSNEVNTYHLLGCGFPLQQNLKRLAPKDPTQHLIVGHVYED